MNILFLTLSNINSLNERGIYQDLLRKFKNEGHNITIVSPIERRNGIKTNIKIEDDVTILKIQTLNITKSHFIEKGFGTLLIDYQYYNGVKKHLNNKKFDLVLYTTPPITLVKAVRYIKRRDNAFSYLLLKDIFPQNAVDMGMMKKGGFLHQYFEKIEKELYGISDKIGCMSDANLNFIHKHNPEIPLTKLEVNPNSIEPIEFNFSEVDMLNIRLKYGLPIDKKILVYGGNLGKPQGLDFLLDVIQHNKNEDAYFLIVGSGTEFNRIQNWFDAHKPKNAKLLSALPKSDYDLLLMACDIGLIFLDPSFTIPNFPSRLLSYLEMKKPIIAATDLATDIGDIIEEYECGHKIISGELEKMTSLINYLVNSSDLNELGDKGFKLLNDRYLVDYSYDLIMEAKENV